MVSGNARLQRLKSTFPKHLGPMKVSAVRNSEVVASWRLLMYYKYRVFNSYLKFCPL